MCSNVKCCDLPQCFPTTTTAAVSHSPSPMAPVRSVVRMRGVDVRHLYVNTFRTRETSDSAHRTVGGGSAQVKAVGLTVSVWIFASDFKESIWFNERISGRNSKQSKAGEITTMRAVA